jgi:hypothetical protein
MFKGITTHLLCAVAAFSFILLAFGSIYDTPTYSTVNSDGTPKSERQLQIDRQFSIYDGSHVKLVKTIKAQMDDPQSFKHIKTVHWDHDDYLIVRTVYSGKNVFRKRMKYLMKAKVSLDGDVLEIIETKDETSETIGVDSP